MGYLIAAHFVKRQPDVAAVRDALPGTIGFAVYKHQSQPIFAIDTYRALKPSRYPFSAATPATDISLALPNELTGLEGIYEDLRAANAANGLKRSYISLSILLSTSLKDQVLSIYTDDDGNDFACLSENGKVVSGAARCEGYLVQFATGNASKTEVSGEPTLHAVASSAVHSFTGVSADTFGFGSFDPPENFGFNLVAKDA